jgi:hypothetical protein
MWSAFSPLVAHLNTWLRHVLGYTYMSGAYHVMHGKYCSLFCGVNVRLQLSFFIAKCDLDSLVVGLSPSH